MNFIPYESRNAAGKILVDFISKNEKVFFKSLQDNPKSSFVFAIPNGGVPVADDFCQHLEIYYDILIVRKLKIPYNPEAGFGSITTDGTVLINKPLLSQLNLSDSQIEASVEKTKTEIQERIQFYKKKMTKEQDYSNRINDKNIVIIDDGLASGFTMLAAIKMIKKYKPKKIYVCVPTAPLHTIERLKPELDAIFCPNIRKTTWFAVADAYKNWYDVPEKEVLEILIKSKLYIEND